MSAIFFSGVTTFSPRLGFLVVLRDLSSGGASASFVSFVCKEILGIYLTTSYPVLNGLINY